MSQFLSADQCVEEVDDHEHRDDEPEEVSPAHVRYEGTEGKREAHTRSIPSISHSRTANAAIPRTTATASMAINMERGPSHPYDDSHAAHNDFVTARGWLRRPAGTPQTRHTATPAGRPSDGPAPHGVQARPGTRPS